MEKSNFHNKLVLQAVFRFSGKFLHFQVVVRIFSDPAVGILKILRQTEDPVPSSFHLVFQFWILTIDLFLFKCIVWPFSICFASQFEP